MAFLNRCCLNSCPVGSVIPRWQNITKVRPAGDTGGTHYTAIPYPRYDSAEWDSENGPPSCLESQPPGTCGNWLVGGDLNGLSAQEVQDTVDDIMTCAAPDATHATGDHNCYFNDGAATVDLRRPKMFGGQWILAKKFWHGIPGLIDRDDPHWITSVTLDATTGAWSFGYSDDVTWPAPYQTKYRTMAVEVTGIDKSYPLTGGVPGSPVTNWTFDGTGADTVGQYTGVHSYSGSYTESGTIPPGGLLTTAAEYFGDANNDWNGWIGYFAQWATTYETPPTTHYETVSGTEWKKWSGTTPDFAIEHITISLGGGGATCLREYPSPPGSRDYFKETLTINNTGIVYEWYNYSEGDTNDVEDTFSVTMSLSDAYTAGQCYADWLNLFSAWNAADLNLASLRTDEELANAPLLLYDEVPSPVAPSPQLNPTMDDYSAAQNTDGTWPQRTLLDGANYVWKYPNGSYRPPSGFTGGATLILPMRTGAVIAHNPAGSDRHFWFNYAKFKRVEFDPGGGATRWEWFNDTYGGFSDGALPPVTLRWMDNHEAQYDGVAYIGADGVPPPGNYPQAFYTQIGGRVIGAKYIAATQKWPGVNFARPCGPDKYAVDQLSVCCVMSGSAGSGLVIQTTFGASDPLAGGGLAIGDFIALGGDGIYQITALTTTSPDGSGNPQWSVTVGARIDDLPTGFAMNDTGTDGSGFMGRLRFPSAPGICGRVAVTTTYSGATLTINAGVAQPWLRKDPVTGSLLVDLYDSAMTSATKIADVNLTRVSDTQWTAALGGAPGIAIAYLVAAGVDYTKNSSASRKTGVHLDWTFDQRAMQSGYPSPPAWYAGVAGCTGCTVTQFYYGGTTCPVLVGIVPFYAGESGSSPVESGPTGSRFFGFPGSVTFDEKFGSHWQAAVMLTMEDPFYQQPFNPTCQRPPDGTWNEDNGTGQLDDTDSTPQVWFYPHRPWVEAMSVIPGGDSLPAGVNLFYDPTVNQIAPPYYPQGIPIGDTDGNYASVETDWGFAGRACATIGSAGRFAGFYSTFVSC